MAFRPCIDLRAGRVVQIVGGTLTDSGDATVNFVADQPSSYFAALYRDDGLRGGHVIMLGPGNESAAREALAAYPAGLQLGGGITPENAGQWLDAGASHVIVTSFLFDGPNFDRDRLAALEGAIGRSRLVVDLSCRRAEDGRYFVATNRWQTITHLEVNAETLATLAVHCDEFLIHAADVEGRCEGIDETLAANLGAWTPLPTTYAGGARDIADIARVQALSSGKVDLTIGSALDIFGGHAPYAEAARLGRR